MSIFTPIFSKLFSFDYWTLKSYDEYQQDTIKLWATLKNKKTSELKLMVDAMRTEIGGDKKKLDKHLPMAFAITCEAIFRHKKLSIFPVQILGAIAIHFGNVAEMRTGEGKTLTALLPAMLNSLIDGQVYIVTVNEYLVERDTTDNKEIFNSLGIQLGSILSTMKSEQKLANYKKDIIYITNSELGFDYLRDNMIGFNMPKMQQRYTFAIVDEADSILIDEARTPLVISGIPINRASEYLAVNKFVKSLKPTDYEIEAEYKRCSLTNFGTKKAKYIFGIKDFYSRNNSEKYHQINNALFAYFILQKNVDYLVRKNKIFLIDHFTGRALENRSYSDGLHQALEAKEDTKISDETSVLATITYQNLFRLFDKISGITGTAVSVKNEFIGTYNMHVVVIPTNLPMIRDDQKDLFFYNKKSKYIALTDEIERLHKIGQPILIGSNSVSTSEDISLVLKKMKIRHNVLSAKHHIYEAEVVAKAGHYKAVTIATNMAGRGTDIKLDEKAKELGGLVMLGAERNESERIDLQLRGRSGRQGEPGRSQFYLSLDDDLFLRFGNKMFKKQFEDFGGESIQSKILSWAINKHQQKLTQSNFDQRKTLLEYDNVISQQRKVVYHQRDFLREKNDFTPYILEFLVFYIETELKWMIANPFHINSFEIPKIKKFAENLGLKIEFNKNESKNLLTQQAVANQLNEQIKKIVTQIHKKEPSKLNQFFCGVLTNKIDETWRTMLTELLRYKSSSFLQSYVQRKPLEYFINSASDLFDNFKIKVSVELGSMMIRSFKELINHEQKT